MGNTWDNTFAFVILVFIGKKSL